MTRSRWTVHGERAVYSSPWVSVSLADVEPTGHERFEHHVIRMPGEAVAAVVRDGRGNVLALWRHRFITGREGWEMPAGKLETGESPLEGAAREVLEETGWTVRNCRHVAAGDVAPGVTDLRHHVVLCEAGERVGEPQHSFESDHVDWVAESELMSLLRRQQLPDGYTQYALLAVNGLESRP